MLVERPYFLFCAAVGRLLRASRYSRVRIVRRGGKLQVRKHRVFHAPLLVWVGGPLMRILDTGVRVLPQREWEQRERHIYRCLYGAEIQIDADGTLVLPYVAGTTLAALLEGPALENSARMKAIELSVGALATFHRQGFTHGDAMAENVMVDLEAGVARWVDFETTHEPSRSMPWRRADDVRALLVTCLLRTVPGRVVETIEVILDAYADEGSTRLVATSFTSVLCRPLIFHLAQAGLSHQRFSEIARLLRARLSQQPDDRRCS